MTTFPVPSGMLWSVFSHVLSSPPYRIGFGFHWNQNVVISPQLIVGISPFLVMYSGFIQCPEGSIKEED